MVLINDNWGKVRDLEDISEITGLSIEEIKKISNDWYENNYPKIG